ncbi:hypothetical protein MNBD_GAMMA01-1030, partial [hydrothermal vent metagenome]
NPIRAKMAQHPEDSEYTSIQERISAKETTLKAFGDHDEDIPFTLDDYLTLIDCTGRAIVGESKDYIPAELPDILARMGLNSNIWLDEIRYFDTWYYKAIGNIENLRKYCKSINQKWIKGLPKISVTVNG